MHATMSSLEHFVLTLREREERREERGREEEGERECMCVCMLCAHVDQRKFAGVSFLLPPCRALGLNLKYEAWWSYLLNYLTGSKTFIENKKLGLER